MTWDFSNPSLSPDDKQDKSTKPSTLEALGWQSFFEDQISTGSLLEKPPVRVTEVHRNAVHVVGNDIETDIPSIQDVTVGDWLLFDRIHPPSSQILERKSVVKRRAPGTGRQIQLIAANIDTAFIVASCNQEFSVARIERYIALAFEAAITPVVVLTKADLLDTSINYEEEAKAISKSVAVVVLDARGDEPRTKLAQWCKRGETVAFLGSSGVGKSTLTNSLAENQYIKTQTIREDDGRGRHTTTSRQLYLVPNGCLVLDTPGMRELQLSNASSGINDVFADILDLSTQCKFNNCQHKTEPGCAITKGVKDGDIDPARLERWRKLITEEASNTTSFAERKLKAREKLLLVKPKPKQKKNKYPKKKPDQ